MAVQISSIDRLKMLLTAFSSDECSQSNEGIYNANTGAIGDAKR